MPLVTAVSRPRSYSSGMPLRMSNIRSRLDSSPNYPESHGILSKQKVIVPAGHRIVVSNLQTTVTQDDIKVCTQTFDYIHSDFENILLTGKFLGLSRLKVNALS